MTHLVESKDLVFFLEAEIVDNIFQWDVMKTMRQIKNYDDMFQAIRALTAQKILKIRILIQKFCKMKVSSHFLSNTLIQIVLHKTRQPFTSHGIIRTPNILFLKNCLSSTKF